MFEYSKHIFRKFVRLFLTFLLTFEFVFDIITTSEQLFSNIIEHSIYLRYTLIQIEGDIKMYKTVTDYNYMERIDARRYSRLARTKQVRRQKLMLAFGLFITILLITIFSLKAFIYANDNINTQMPVKQFSSIMIYCGDSIESISEERFATCGYSSSHELASEIISINHLSNDSKLIPGNYIVVPYYIAK